MIGLSRGYVRDVGSNFLISVEEEKKLGRKIRKGDEEAWRLLVIANLRLVIIIAKDFRNKGLLFDDLVAEGNIGLMTAAKKFDSERGVKFSSYAAYWIKHAMWRAINIYGRQIRIPSQIIESRSLIERTRFKLEQRFNRTPTMEELVEHTGLTKKFLHKYKWAKHMFLPLDGEFEYANSCNPSKLTQKKEFSIWFEEIANGLTDRQRKILVNRFGLNGGRPKTLEELSRTIGLSHERIRQIQKQALRHLKRVLVNTKF